MNQSAPLVIAVLVALLLWIFAVPKTITFFEFLGWLGSAGAAIFAAISARATLETVREMRRAHVEERRPELTLDAGADYFSVAWPDASGSDPIHAQYRGHFRGPRPAERSAPFFHLENFGGSAALDLRVTFSCIEEFTRPPVLPPHYQSIPYGSTNRLSYNPTSGWLTFHQLGSSFVDRPAPSHTTFHSHCGPAGNRVIALPRQVVWWLALRVLERAASRGMLEPYVRQTLRITASYRSATEGVNHADFLFTVDGSVTPDPVNGSPAVMWAGASDPELKIFLEFHPQPRPASGMVRRPEA